MKNKNNYLLIFSLILILIGANILDTGGHTVLGATMFVGAIISSIVLTIICIDEKN